MKKKSIIDFPNCWEEVSTEEWVELLRLREALRTRKGIRLKDVKREWCAFTLARRGVKVKGISAMLLVNALAETLQWMWEEDPESHLIALRLDTTKNLLPRWDGLIGPLSHGADLTFGEFRAATAAAVLYEDGHLPSDLLALTASLYRPEDPATGKKEAFNTEELPRYMKEVQRMPDWIRWGVYAWFSGFSRYLTEGDFLIDGKTVCFSPLFTREKGNASGGYQDLGLNSILYTVAESGVFGTAADTERTPLLRVLLKLLDDKQRADEITKQYKKK